MQWPCMRENNSDRWLAPVKEQLELSCLLAPKELTDTAACTVTASTSITHPWVTATDNLGPTECFMDILAKSLAIDCLNKTISTTGTNTSPRMAGT